MRKAVPQDQDDVVVSKRRRVLLDGLDVRERYWMDCILSCTSSNWCLACTGLSAERSL